MYIFKVCTAVQHTNAIRITSLPDVMAFSPSTREMQHCITERHEGHRDQQRPDPPPRAPALWMEGWLLAKMFWPAVWFSTGAVVLYSFLEHREKAPEMPGRVLLLLKKPKYNQTEARGNAGRKDKHPHPTHILGWRQVQCSALRILFRFTSTLTL